MYSPRGNGNDKIKRGNFVGKTGEINERLEGAINEKYDV